MKKKEGQKRKDSGEMMESENLEGEEVDLG